PPGQGPRRVGGAGSRAPGRARPGRDHDRMTALEDLRSVERADVLKGGRLAARLVRRRDSVVFAYEEEYAAAAARPVATTLPVSREPVVTHAAGALPPFFSGLLPEGRRLSALRAAVKTSADD